MTAEVVMILGLCGLLGVALAAYERQERELKAIKKRQEQIEDKARERAFKILEDAKDRSLGILKEARIVAEENKEAIGKRLDEVADKQIKGYEDVLQTISKTVETDTVRELEEFEHALKLETVGAEQAVEKKLETEFANVRAEIEKYKQMKLKVVDEKMIGIIEEVTRAVIGKNLSLIDHAEIVMQALEEAKKKNVL
jgi:hypothetical protein